MEGLTAVFGKGTGVPPPPWPPGQRAFRRGREDSYPSHRPVPENIS